MRTYNTQGLVTPIYGLNRLGIYNRANAISSYEITDHLGNVRVVVQKENGTTTIKSYADYYPFGEQLPMRNSLSSYRYAFQGQELDGETGMEAFQLRLWDGRIGRWLSPDPMGQYESPYLGMGNNPVNGVDSNGGWFGDPPTSGCGNGDTWNDGTNSWTNVGGAWFNDNDKNIVVTSTYKRNFLNFKMPSFDESWTRLNNINVSMKTSNSGYSISEKGLLQLMVVVVVMETRGMMERIVGQCQTELG